MLLRNIAQKDKDLEKAKESLALFASYFEPKLQVYAEVQAKNLGYPEKVAFEAIQCTFAKVWKYPTFDMKKSRCKDEEIAIIVWLKNIVASQMNDYVKKGVCTQQTEEEDLSVIEDSESFVDCFPVDLPMERKIALVQAMDKKISVLDEKHRIIYLTYKAYSTRGKKLQRRLLEKLRKRLGLTQTTVRVYKKEAYDLLGDKTDN